jgi:hypothetical protein
MSSGGQKGFPGTQKRKKPHSQGASERETGFTSVLTRKWTGSGCGWSVGN